jgi:hypothetical protein
VRRSCYASGLRPWVERFPREQLYVVRLEDLVDDDGAAWRALLRHLGVTEMPRPDGAFNVTADKGQFTAVMRLLWERGLIPDARRMPQTMRRLARSVLIRSGHRTVERLAASEEHIPERFMAAVWADVDGLPALLGDDRLTWR